MPLELQMLVLMTFLFMIAWLPASSAKRRAYGDEWLVSNRDMAGLPSLPGWGERAERALANLKENYPAFAVAILILAVTGQFTMGTAIASIVFVAARILHMIVYIAGWVWPRTLFWVIGWLATLYLLGVAVF
jgi:uncharacterized MAPEG superfamily protein